jgi:branched-chain amino acid transport system substrate-binding protein
VNALGKPLFEGKGLTLDVVTVPVGAPDATPQVTAALQDKPDAIYIVHNTPGCQAILSALVTAGSSVPLQLASPCTKSETVDAVGPDAYKNAVSLENFVVNGDDDESKLFEAVMQQYAPSTPTEGPVGFGYMTMLALVRAVDAAASFPEGAVTPADVVTAVRAASDLPLPAGGGKTFTCAETQFPSPAITGATICSPWVPVREVTDGVVGDTTWVDASQALPAS